MKVVYIAGKYRGPNAWAVEQNIRAAEEVAARVWAMGLVALCPHTNGRHMECVSSDEHMLAGTLELMRRCDAVVLVPGWGSSAGTRAEIEEAKRLGIPVFGIDSHLGDYKRVTHADANVAELAKWWNAETSRALGLPSSA